MESDWIINRYLDFILPKLTQMDLYDDEAVLQRMCSNPLMFDYIMENYESHDWNIKMDFLNEKKINNDSLLNNSVNTSDPTTLFNDPNVNINELLDTFNKQSNTMKIEVKPETKLTMDILVKYRKILWNWESISAHPSITMSDIIVI